MSNKDIKYLSHQVTPEYGAIIWLTDEPISTQTRGYYEINYLLDGLLSEELASKTQERKKQSLFTATSFGQNFFVLHSLTHSLTDLQNIKSLLQFVKEDDRKKILILNNSKQTAGINILQEFSENFTDFEFKNLII